MNPFATCSLKEKEDDLERMSYRLINRHNREEFILLFLKRNWCTEDYLGTTYLLEPIDEAPKTSILTRKVRERWPDARWFLLKGNPYSSGMHPVAQIADRFFILRNGNNISWYNIAVLDSEYKEFYFRRNIDQAIEVVRILSCDPEEVPLLLGVCQECNNPIVETWLRGE